MSSQLSRPDPPCLCATIAEKQQRVADNLIRQYDEIVRLVNASKGILNITPDLLKNLQRIAVDGIYPCAGHFRSGPIYISGTSHKPPDCQDVPKLVDEMCEYANSTPGSTPIHTSAYLMWRLNWIHPFSGGNGRTSRAISHFALCARLGYVVPGIPTIPEQIMANRDPYFHALDLADDASVQGRVDVSEMERLLSNMLTIQLGGILTQAGAII